MARQRLAYLTDLTDEEWQVLKPLLPPEKSGGRPRKYALREVINGLQYGLRGGCAWRLMPHDLPPWQTADQSFRAWRQEARGGASTITSASGSAPAWGVTRSPRPPSSTPRR
jgi:putative transposase